MTRARTAPAPRRAPRWTAAAGAGLLGASLTLTGCTVAEDPTSMATAASNTFLDGVLATPSATSADPLAADREFSVALLRNHRDAVEQSETLLAKDGVDDDVRNAAEDQRDGHQARIVVLEERLAAWGVEPSASPEPSVSGSLPADEQAAADGQITIESIRAGVLTPREKEVFEAADGEDAGRIYLLQMHRLLQAGMTLAGTELEEGTDEETRRAAQEMLDGHQDTMRKIVEMLHDRGAIAADPRDMSSPSGFTGPIHIEGVGADGGTVEDFTPSAAASVKSKLESQRSSSPAEGSSGDDSSEPSPSPSPADTAQASPSR